MHANVQLRICAATGDMAPYYRLKESYRDVRGVVHSLIVLNIGFEPALTPKRMHKIAHALTARFQNRNQPGLFDDQLAGLDETETLFAEKYWRAMIDNGQMYWVVNTIRLQLKRQGEPAFWTEIVRRMRTQKLVTTTATNALGEQVKFRMCSEPSQQAKDIYRKLGYKEAPFKKIKICRTHEPPN